MIVLLLMLLCPRIVDAATVIITLPDHELLSVVADNCHRTDLLFGIVKLHCPDGDLQAQVNYLADKIIQVGAHSTVTHVTYYGLPSIGATVKVQMGDS